MKKKTHYWFGPLLLAVVTYGGCESSTNMVLTDNNDPVTIVIKRDAVKDPTTSDVFTDFNKYSRLSVLNYFADIDLMISPEINPEQSRILGWLGRSRSHVNMWSVIDIENMTALDFGHVTLGDYELFLSDTSSSKIWLDGHPDPDRVIPLVYKEFFPKELDGGQGVFVDFFAGVTQFTFTGSEDLGEVSTQVTLPERNFILDLNKDDEIDPNEDWTIQLRFPLRASQNTGIVIHEHIPGLSPNGLETRFEGVSHAVIQVTEETDTIVIPNAELKRLSDESEENIFLIKVWHIGKVDEVDLFDTNGASLQTLDVIFYSIHTVQFKFKE